MSKMSLYKDSSYSLWLWYCTILLYFVMLAILKYIFKRTLPLLLKSFDTSSPINWKNFCRIVTNIVSLSLHICFCICSGAKLPFEAMFVSHKDSASNPTIVVLHGGPHSVYPSSYSKSLAFLFSQGYNLLVVNYR